LLRTAIALLTLLGSAADAAAVDNDSPDERRATRPQNVAALPAAFDGPAPPLPPEIIARDEQGRATVRAVRLTAPLHVDGSLDESIYSDVKPISDFIQNDPREGEPATEKSEVWVMFDGSTLYLAARCWESEPERMVVNEMRRDNTNIVQNEGIAFGFDTFFDRRNAVVFEMNAIGGRIDGQVTNERQMNLDWNPVWQLQTGRFQGGWTVEVAIPFRSLRYRAGRDQVWGFNVRRVNRWKNEVSYLTRIPASMTLRGHFQSSLMATLVGLEVPASRRNAEVKPFATSHVITDRTAAPPTSNDFGADVGTDLKYALTQGLTADLTVKTDFAQVEADEQQVNLTRFSLFFPEKRDFFLENQGLFAFGGNLGIGGGGAGGGGGGGQGGASATPSDTPLLFYSRRIGLADGHEIPIGGGGRVSGRSGRYSLGLLNIQTLEEPAYGVPSTNFAVMRMRRDILRKSNVGAIFTNRSALASGAGSNQAYGLDTALGFHDNLTINGYWARTETDGLDGDDMSYRGQLDYTGDRYGVQVERLDVGAGFNPEIGYVRRTNMERSFGLFRFSPRPRRSKTIRRFSMTGSVAYVENGQGRLETREQKGEFAVEFQSSDRWSTQYLDSYEFLPLPFTIAPGVTLPVQGYDFGSVRTAYTFGQQHPVSGEFAVERGSFYDGDKTSIAWNRGRLNVTPQLSIEPRFSIDWVDLAEGSFVTRLVGSRLTYTISPLMFVSSLLQYTSASNAVSANVRLRWEYQPGSELFVVWNEQRDTLSARFPDLMNRSFVVKVTRLLQF
jgi:hypothetical protein